MRFWDLNTKLIPCHHIRFLHQKKNITARPLFIVQQPKCIQQSQHLGACKYMPLYCLSGKRQPKLKNEFPLHTHAEHYRTKAKHLSSAVDLAHRFFRASEGGHRTPVRCIWISAGEDKSARKETLLSILSLPLTRSEKFTLAWVCRQKNDSLLFRVFQHSHPTHTENL